jgi:hypothetical protein
MKRTHVAVQRATAFARLLPMIEELGSSPAAALAGTGLSINDLKPDGFIPYRAALAFLENAAAMTGREDLGLRLGDQQNLASLGPLGEAMFHAKTLGEALADFTHTHTHSLSDHQLDGGGRLSSPDGRRAHLRLWHLRCSGRRIAPDARHGAGRRTESDTRVDGRRA